MRILITGTHRNLVGGVEKYLQAIIPGLLARGHDLGLLYQYAAPPGGEPIDPPDGSVRSWCLNELGIASALDSIARWKPDIVYSHGFDRQASIQVEDALLEAYPIVLYVHNYDRTCASGQKCFAFPQYQACTRKIGPMCLVLHYPRRCGGLNPKITWEWYRRNSHLNSRLPDHHAILVASTHMYRELQRHGVPPSKLHLAPLPTTDVTPASTTAEPKQPENILFVGRLTGIKGADHLIEAIPKAAAKLGRALTLTIAGDGPQGPALRNAAHRLGVQVRFTGWVQTPEKLELIRQASLLAVPSLWPEPFGLVGTEAGCLGVPAVGYATGGIPDWLIGGETGELAPSDPPTVDGLADAIVRALASPDHFARLCAGAWRLAQRFSLEKHLAQLEPILCSEAARAAPCEVRFGNGI
jgi:glycosyltransferase involved in cell wall biosynthesis